MNEFSIVCRILGSLFYRQPNDPALTPLFNVIKSGALQAQWPLKQEGQLEKLQNFDMDQLQQDYQAMFTDQGSVSMLRSCYLDRDNSDCRHFLQSIEMPVNVENCDNFALLLLAASWVEDHFSGQQAIIFQRQLFNQLLAGWSSTVLGKVEAHASTAFYRNLAIISREALQAMLEELEETSILQSEE